MKDYTMDLARTVASIVKEVLGDGLTVDVAYTPDGNSVLLKFDGYPLYPNATPGKVFVQFPRSTFYVRKQNICFTEIQQAQCRFYQEEPGKAFAHPHIFSDGHPCWDKGKRDQPMDFITNIIETLTLQNVTPDSIHTGHCARGIMGVGEEGFRTAMMYKKKVAETLKCNPVVEDHMKLEKYVTNRWKSKIDLLTMLFAAS